VLSVICIQYPVILLYRKVVCNGVLNIYVAHSLFGNKWILLCVADNYSLLWIALFSKFRVILKTFHVFCVSFECLLNLYKVLMIVITLEVTIVFITSFPYIDMQDYNIFEVLLSVWYFTWWISFKNVVFMFMKMLKPACIDTTNLISFLS
jgi:hypothetical protein